IGEYVNTSKKRERGCNCVAHYFDQREQRLKPVPNCGAHGLVWTGQRCERLDVLQRLFRSMGSGGVMGYMADDFTDYADGGGGYVDTGATDYYGGAYYSGGDSLPASTDYWLPTFWQSH